MILANTPARPLLPHPPSFKSPTLKPWNVNNEMKGSKSNSGRRGFKCADASPRCSWCRSFPSALRNPWTWVGWRRRETADSDLTARAATTRLDGRRRRGPAAAKRRRGVVLEQKGAPPRRRSPSPKKTMMTTMTTAR